MTDSLLSRTFDEGAPLDPTQLNNLRQDLVNVMTTANTALSNQTVNGQTTTYKYVYDCGQISLNLVKGSTPAKNIPLSSEFVSTGTLPMIVASISTTLASSDVITLYSHVTSATNGQIGAVSNVNTTVNVNWIAIQKVSV